MNVSNSCPKKSTYKIQISENVSNFVRKSKKKVFKKLKILIDLIFGQCKQKFHKKFRTLNLYLIS